MDDIKEVFGDGTEYDWALQLQEEEDQEQYHNANGGPLSKPIELKDVFEPSQLAERMLTDEDNLIRATDEPERFQIARAPYKDVILTDEQVKEEATWISNSMMQRRKLDASLQEPFQKSVAKVLEFITIDEFEPPFIFQHRKDYLIHADRVPLSPNPNNPDGPQYAIQAEKLLNQTDLWDIFEYDLKFRGLIDKRNALQRTYDNLLSVSGKQDPIFDEMLPLAVTMEELQDVQDYLHFQHAAKLTDIATMNASTAEKAFKRPGGEKAQFERIRAGKVYNLVRAFGITANDFAQNALSKSRRHYTEDPSDRPEDLAKSPDVLEEPEYTSSAQCIRAAKAMFAEEITLNPTMRKVMRIEYYMTGVIDCVRTEKGLKKIDDQHIYAEFKYLRNLTLPFIANKPELFLRMCKAEEEGLVEIKVRIKKLNEFKKMLYSVLESDNFSDVAESWNRLRREALDAALSKLDKIMARGLKENLKSECENQVAKICREAFLSKLDQAPYKPKGMILGTIPRVLALSNGNGTYGRDAICWAWVEEDGRVLENGKWTDLSSGDADRGINDGADVAALCELVRRRSPDVIAVSGFSADTRKLYKQLEQLVDIHNLHGGDYEGEEPGSAISAKLEVIIVNDEVARLYQTSERANMEHPGFAPLTKYCVGLAKYVQNPLKEYASLGADIASVSFDKDQAYVPKDKLLKQLESAIVDIVNLCGVDVNEAVNDPYTANLLPYVCGLGPRKASQLLKAISINGGVVHSRAELVGDAEEHKIPAVGPRVWNNCASFLWIEFDSSEPESDYLDNTRVHPQDYDLGRKMAADALELDEEDIQAEQQENGVGAIVRKLIKDEAQEKVNDLILEEYAEQLEKNFNQRKRATLETIRAELQQPYEELRRNFALLSTNEIFTMFTSETPESLCEGMIVPMAIRRVQDDAIEGRLDCGVECQVQSGDITHRMDVSPKQIFQPHQTVQGKIRTLNRKYLTAQLSLLEEDLREPYHRDFDWNNDEWDHAQERKDIEAMQVKNDFSGRTQRVIKHPLFHPFNSPQAEEFLGSQARGDCVIRPSSKGLDHLAVTWKVANGVYQHIDVLELDKENEFSVGRTLRIGGRFNYSDLDDLIVNHVKAMARKVEELMLHEKFKDGSKSEIGRLYLSHSPRIHILTIRSQTDGSPPTPRRIPSAPLTSFARLPNTPATSNSASSGASRSPARHGLSRSSPVHTSCRRCSTKT